VVRAALALFLLSRAAYAQPCDPKEAEELRAHLEHEQHRASVWNWSWRIAFTASAVGSFAVGYANPFPSLQDGLYVSAGKAGIAAAARWILPLRVDVPDANADTCADISALHKALERAAKRERSNFWLNHIGGILVNGAGAVIIAERGSLGQGLLSVAIGYPIGLLSNYTAPRDSWHRWRERTWTVAAVPRDDGFMVLLTF
jgi:hypothetical protein